TIGLPLTNGFIGEFLLLNGVFQFNIWYGAIAGLTIILGAVYMLRMYKTVMQGTTNELTASFKDINGTEVLVLGIVCLVIIAIGVYPNALLQISEASVQNLIAQVNSKLSF